MENTDTENEEHKPTHNQSAPAFTMHMLSVFFLCIFIRSVFEWNVIILYTSLQYIFITQ